MRYTEMFLFLLFFIRLAFARFGAPNVELRATLGSLGPRHLSQVTSTALWPLPVSDSRSSSCNFTLLGKDVAATGNDCPYSGHGPDSSLEVCQTSCASAGGDVCTNINWNPIIPDCVFRRCTDPLHPNLTSQPGYSVFFVQRPQVVTYGLESSHSFVFSLAPQSFSNPVLEAAMARAKGTAFAYGEGSPSTLPGPIVNSLEVMVTTSDAVLRIGVDETYSLQVDPTSGNPAKLTAPTIFGAIRGLETFSQLLSFNFTDHTYSIESSVITDGPRFPFRGLMLVNRFTCFNHSSTHKLFAIDPAKPLMLAPTLSPHPPSHQDRHFPPLHIRKRNEANCGRDSGFEAKCAFNSLQ